jgi:hypothetical protein
MRSVIWFNDGLSVMAEAIQALRPYVDEIIVSHKNPYFVGFDQADQVYIEQKSVKVGEYVAWALDFATRHEVTHFFVGRHARYITEREAEFAAAGVKLMFSLSPEQWDDIDDKSLFYKRLIAAGHADMLPIWHTWNDSGKESLSALVNAIRGTDGAVDREACVKPVRGIFGEGFFRFSANPDPRQQLFKPEEKIIRHEEFGTLACASALNLGKTQDWMVMEFLPGPEYSVDTLAHDGKIVTYVARQKGAIDSEGQVISGDADIAVQLNNLAEVFNLSGVFNAQFRRDVDGNLKVMEINPRFSGGMGMSLKAGVNLPMCWLTLSHNNGEMAVVPQAKVGMRVYSWHQAVELTDHRDA